jgi:translation initiation factor 5
LLQVEGKGNGIKTVIVNMVDVAKALCRPPSYTCKYFGCELGAQTQMAGGRYIVNGAHEGTKLQELLDGFIRRFVLCSECDNPETDLIVQAGKGRIVQTCKACGHTGLVDMRHKLTTFILKNPVGPGGTIVEENGKSGGKKGGKKARAGKGKGGKESTQSPNHDQQPQQEEGFEGPPTMNGGSEEEEEWSVDTSEAAVKQRMENLSSQATNLALTSDLEKSSQDRVNMLFDFVKSLKDGSGGAEGLVSQKQKIKAEAERLDVVDKAAGVLAELLFDVNILQQIKDYRSLFLVFIVENRKAQKYLLGVFEMLVGEKEQLKAKVPHILKAFYDHDIVEEEALLEWADKVRERGREGRGE